VAEAAGRDETEGARAREDAEEVSSDIAGKEYDGAGETGGSAAIKGSEERGASMFRSAIEDVTTSTGDVLETLLQLRGSFSGGEDARNFAIERFRLGGAEAEKVTKSAAYVLLGLVQTRAWLSEAEDNSRKLSEYDSRVCLSGTGESPEQLEFTEAEEELPDDDDGEAL